ncbi:hypothetical protein PO369_05720 [Phytobacter diazotrophicus]|uniref:hypothetical protein n=1 Tax=Phytobacter diazotrophicus TaxID=395631 RepID=UPI001451858F|nr:hypothetical protein [Phytobacter diazotrophicus]QJF16645.1 hypothetical protein HHA33_08900 [Phytobacter diazotrophicus]
MKSRRFALGVLLLAFSSMSSAVDGYKGVKFGSAFKDLKAAKLCTWKKYEDNSIKGMDSYYCENFKFSGLTTVAMAFFLDGSFERFSIVVDKSQNVTALAESLVQKYGKPSSSFTDDELRNVQKNGGELTIKFDNDTVMLGIKHDVSTNTDSTMLLYSSSEYFGKLGKLQKSGFDNDL